MLFVMVKNMQSLILNNLLGSGLTFTINRYNIKIFVGKSSHQIIFEGQ